MSENKKYIIDKETKKQYNKTYYDKHKNELLNKLKVKKLCDVCNCSITKSNFYEHLKTKKHIKNIKII